MKLLIASSLIVWGSVKENTVTLWYHKIVPKDSEDAQDFSIKWHSALHIMYAYNPAHFRSLLGYIYKMLMLHDNVPTMLARG